MPTEREFELGSWRVDPARGAILRGGKEVRLEPKLMELLLVFAASPSRIISKDEIIARVWNGRAISKLLLREPIFVQPGLPVSLIELIPPPHQNVYQMGLEHVGIVVTDDFEAFAAAHAAAFTGRQYQSEICQPWYIAFEDHTNVKFYDLSLHDVVVAEGRPFDGFHHAID